MSQGEIDRLHRVKQAPHASDAHYRECAKAPAPEVQHPPIEVLIAKRPVIR